MLVFFTFHVSLLLHYRECNSDTVNALERILEIWKERDVYDQIFLDRLKKGMCKYFDMQFYDKQLYYFLFYCDLLLFNGPENILKAETLSTISVLN